MSTTSHATRTKNIHDLSSRHAIPNTHDECVLPSASSLRVILPRYCLVTLIREGRWHLCYKGLETSRYLSGNISSEMDHQRFRLSWASVTRLHEYLSFLFFYTVDFNLTPTYQSL